MTLCQLLLQDTENLKKLWKSVTKIWSEIYPCIQPWCINLGKGKKWGQISRRKDIGFQGKSMIGPLKSYHSNNDVFRWDWPTRFLLRRPKHTRFLSQATLQQGCIHNSCVWVDRGSDGNKSSCMTFFWLSPVAQSLHYFILLYYVLLKINLI